MPKSVNTLIFSLLLAFCFCAHGQEHNGQGRFRHLTAKDGFTSASVITIYKDSQGFIWLGAFDGLYRYDGYHFKLYTNLPSDPNSLSNNSINNILEDQDGNLWIGSMWYGLNKYNKTEDNFTRYFPNPDTSLIDVNGILSIYQDRDGAIWAGTPTGGLHQYIDSSDSFISYKYDTVEKVNFKNFASCLLEDSKGNFWVGTWDGLFLFDRKEKKYCDPDFLNKAKGIYFFNRDNQFYAFEDHIINRDDIQNVRYKSIYEDSKGILWFATSMGLLKYDPNLNELTWYESQTGDPASLSSNTVNKIIEDPFSDSVTLWISSYRGLNQFNTETGKNIRYFHDPVNSQSLPFSVIHDLYLDNDGLLWVGVENSGVSILNLANTHYEYFPIESLQDQDQMLSATSFLKDRIGFTWVGANKGGLFRYDKDMRLVDHYHFSGSNFIYSMHETDAGQLAVGTLSGLFSFDRPNHEFKKCTLICGNSVLKRARVNAMYKDSFGWYWIGTAIVNKGLFYQEPETDNAACFHQITQYPLEHTDIRDFYEDENKVLWVATNGGGIYLLKPENRDSLFFERFEEDRSIPLLLNTLTIHADQNGFLWFGGPNGLTRYSIKNNNMKHFNSSNGLDADAIYDIVGDERYLWLSSDKGLLRFDPNAPQDEMVKIMKLSDGIPFEDIYTYDIYRSEDSMIHVGGKRGSRNGFYRFNPNNIKENQHIPPVVITSFRVKNKPFQSDSSITVKKHLILKHHQNYFSLEFAALDYVNPERNQYAYKLEGVDEDWVKSGNRRFVNYTGIGPGSYLFRVKGSNNDGVWNDEGVSMHITILPPPWKTWWAYALYVFFIILILFSIIRFYLRRQRLLHKLEMDQLQLEKLEELDAMKSNFFANISHEFRTPLTLILGPIEKIMEKIKDINLQQDLSMMQRNAKRLQILINQLLSLSKLESGKLKLHTKEADIVSHVRNYMQSFESLANQKQIDLQFKSDKKNILLYFDQDKIEKVLNNLLSNAFKHTPQKGSIQIEVSTHETAVRIDISDTGKGIPPENIPHIFDRFYQADEHYSHEQEGSGIGLALTKELIELHYGKVSVKSAEGKGTTFNITLPLGKEHLKDEEVDSESTEPAHVKTGIKPVIAEPIEYTTTEIRSFPDLENDARPILLIVEDNADLRIYIRNYLDETYQVVEATNGKDGLKQAIMHIPDLIISDIMMPEMNGYELCKNLKKDERTSHIPVILLTARASMDSKIEGLEMGADDFITKPFDKEELQVRIKNLIQQRKRLKDIILRNIGSVRNLSASGVSSVDQTFLKKAVEVVGKSISDSEFSVEMFAKEMSMSRVQLHRKLTALLEKPASDFIRTIRLNKAAQLLTKKTGNIAEIAYDVGFTNPSHFSKCFREQFGKLPSEFTSIDPD
ncbi:MAG: response regulator [Bacteroidales bacterium]|nr:response regulator [Bacteroidales bacterium]